MIKLYFIRHCESTANAMNLLASQIDYPLSEKGLKDADLIAKEFYSKFMIDKIISSPLTRTLQTGAPFSKLFGLKIDTDKRLMEQYLGSFSGRTFEELKDEPAYEWDRAKRWDWAPLGGGESYRMLAERVEPFLLDLEKINAGERILVVTHAVTLRLIKAHLESTLPKYTEELPDNGEIWEVDFEKLGKQHRIKSHFFGRDKKTLAHE